MFAQARLYILLAAGLGIALASGSAAWKVQEWRYKALDAERVERERETTVMRRKAANGASTEHEQDKVTLNTEFRTIDREVERVITKIVYRDRPCLDDDGVRVLQAAIRATGAASEPSSPVPTPAHPAGR